MDLERQERGRDDEGQVLAPGLFKVKANSLEDPERCIAEGRQADSPQYWIVEKRRFVEDKVYKARLGVEAQIAGDPGEHVIDVLVKKAHRAHADGDEEQSQKEFVGCDQN